MLQLGEDTAKGWLRQRGLPVPAGEAAATPEEAACLAASMPAGVMVKAIVPTGRRGKVGAVLAAGSAAEAAEAARQLLGQIVYDYPVRRVYVEEHIDIATELYLALTLSGPQPEMLVSRHGGIDIEATAHHTLATILRKAIHPIRGLTSWDAIDMW